MRLVLLGILATTLLSACSLTGNQAALDISAENYRVYRGDGTRASLAELLSEAAATQVVFLGESHNDPVAHFLEAEIYQELWRPGLALSLEMFERDVQFVLDEYLDDLINDSHLKESGRAWRNYDSDYKPLIEFAKSQGGTVIAANAPRRYVNLVGREGSEALTRLSPQALASLPPLPYTEASEAYREKFMGLMQMPGMASQEQHDGAEESEANSEERHAADSEENDAARAELHLSLERSLQAQSLWDDTMAWSIARYLQSEPDARVLQVNGVFHSADGLGIPEHLQHYLPGTSTLVISIIESDSFPDFDTEDMLDAGDYVIVTDAALPRSF